MFLKMISDALVICIFLNVLLILFPVNHCTLPQASQEELLHSFKSYSDVAMFHYTIPKEVLRVTWQFAAFMDDPSCEPRKVYIHLRFGSYPIISNETFATNMHVEHDNVIIVEATTAYQQKIATIVPNYGPYPGDWFAGAYMPYWNEKIQQQGLGHKCEYGIGTVALWTQMDDIKNIPVGYEKILRTSATTTYYKIYIPSGIWSFRLSIWNCNFTLHSVHDIYAPCIENMLLKGRALPVVNQSYSMKFVSLTTDSNYTFIENSPYENSYYYLLIVSSSVIEFKIKVDVTECPIKVIKRSFTRQYVNTASILNSLTKLRNKDLLKYEGFYKGNNINDYSENQFYQQKERDANTCIPRYQLTRVKNTEPFSTVYLLQGNELSARMILTDSVPVITQFNILPLIDIGGILDIGMHLKAEKLSTKQQYILITMCLQRGHIPRLNKYFSCQNETASMNLSSLDKHNVNLLIPYPQPDTWYIIIYAACYRYSERVNCQHEEIPVILNIGTKKCVFSNGGFCERHGVCQGIQKDIFHYATCNCFEGYRGWGCTDALEAIQSFSSIKSTIMLVLSNGFFVPAIYIAIKRGMYTEGLIYSTTMLFSSFYHACDQNGEKYCIAKYEVLQYNDFFSSILAFWVTLVAIAQLPSALVSLCQMIGVFVITFAVLANRTYLINILIPLSIGAIIPILTHLYRAFRSRKCKKLNGKMIIGLIVAMVGLSVYSFIETEKNYYYVHSLWHIVIAISLIFLLPSMKSEQTSSLRNTSSNDDIESSNCKEFYRIPTFTIIADQENRIISLN